MDDDKLREALAAGKLPIDDEKVTALREALRSLRAWYAAEKGEKAFGEGLLPTLQQISTAAAGLAQMIDADDRVEPTLAAFRQTAVDTIRGLRALSDAAKDAALAIDANKLDPKGWSEDHEKIEYSNKGRREALTTALYLRIRETYGQLRGEKPRRGLNGPLYRFARACTQMIDSDIDFPKPAGFTSLLREHDYRLQGKR